MAKSLESAPKFESFYAENYNKVYWYIYKKISSEEDAKDLTGDVFFACYDHYASYDPSKSSITTWLYVIVNNKLKNYYRDKKPTVPFDEKIDENAISYEDYGEEAVYLQNCRDMLADAISSLPPKNQMIVILKFFGDKQSNEISTITNMSPINVRVTLNRSLKKIQSYFIQNGWNGE